MTTQTEIEAFAAQVSAMLAEYHIRAKNVGSAPVILCERGPKYTRLVSQETGKDGTVYSRSAYGFVVNENGDLLKSAGWKSPAKGVRSNIANPDAMKRCSPWSVA